MLWFNVFSFSPVSYIDMMHYVHKFLCLLSASPSTISFSQLVTSYLSVVVPALCTYYELCYVISAVTTLYPEDSVSHTPPHPLALTTFLAPFPLMLLEPQRGWHRCTPFTANHSISALWPAMILLNWPHFNLNYMLFLNMSFHYRTSQSYPFVVVLLPLSSWNDRK